MSDVWRELMERLKQKAFDVTCLCRDGYGQWNRTLAYNVVRLEDVREAIHFVPEIAHTYIKCPKCGSPDFEVVQGRGVWLESIKGAK